MDRSISARPGTLDLEPVSEGPGWRPANLGSGDITPIREVRDVARVIGRRRVLGSAGTAVARPAGAAHGRPRIPDRAAFTAIVFVLVTGINRHRALLVRWSKKDENHLALLMLACGLIAFKKARTAALAAAQPG